MINIRLAMTTGYGNDFVNAYSSYAFGQIRLRLVANAARGQMIKFIKRRTDCL